MWGLNNLMVTAAHRYCLGRRTYIVSECVDWLISIWNFLDLTTKKRIIEETQEALDKDHAGDKCDIEQWERLINVALKESARDEG